MEIDYLGIINGRFQFSTLDCGMAGAITPIDPPTTFTTKHSRMLVAPAQTCLLNIPDGKVFFLSSGETEAQEIFLLAQSQPLTGDLVREISYTLPRL